MSKLFRFLNKARAGGGALTVRAEQGQNVPMPLYWQYLPIYVDMLRSGTFGSVTGTASDFRPNFTDGFPATDFIATPQQPYDPYWPGGITLTFKVVAFDVGTVSFSLNGYFTNLKVTHDSGDNWTITVDSPTDRRPALMSLKFVNTKRNSGDPVNTGVRSIICIRPGYESTYQTKTITDEFIAACQDFTELRFMDFQGANNDRWSTTWASRVTPGGCRGSDTFDPATGLLVSGNIGKPVEDIVEICNATGCNAWLHVPAHATDDWVTGMATYVDANLDPDLTVTVEYYNEYWNWSFANAADVTAMSCADIRGYFDMGSGTRKLKTAVRTNNVVRLTFGEPHGWANNELVRFQGLGVSGGTGYIADINLPVTVIDSTTADIAWTGVDGAYVRDGPDPDLRMNSNFRCAAYSSKTATDLKSNDPYEAGQRYGYRRTVQISDAIRAVVGNSKMMTRWNPVLAWQMASDHYSVLQYLANDLGVVVKDKIKATAGAPYFFGVDSNGVYVQYGIATPGSADYKPTSEWYQVDYSEDVVSDAYVYSAASAKSRYKYEQHFHSAKRFGIEAWMYEGGPDMATPDKDGLTDPQKAVRTASIDRKYKALYKPNFSQAYFGFTKDLALGGINKIMHYHMGLASSGSQWGSWDLTKNLETISPKWQGMRDFNATKSGMTYERNRIKAVGTTILDSRRVVNNFNNPSGQPWPSWGSLPYGMDGLFYVIAVEAAGTYTFTFTYNRISNATARTYTFDVNGTTVEVFNTGSLGINTWQATATLDVGLNAISLLRDQSQGVETELQGISVARLS